MKARFYQSWQFWACVGLAVFATLVFKTGLYRSDKPKAFVLVGKTESGAHWLSPNYVAKFHAETNRNGGNIEAAFESIAEPRMETTTNFTMMLPPTNKPAVRWSELGDGKATNSPICK